MSQTPSGWRPNWAAAVYFWFGYLSGISYMLAWEWWLRR
jgi:hypothetical protein